MTYHHYKMNLKVVARVIRVVAKMVAMDLKVVAKVIREVAKMVAMGILRPIATILAGAW